MPITVTRDDALTLLNSLTNAELTDEQVASALNAALHAAGYEEECVAIGRGGTDKQLEELERMTDYAIGRACRSDEEIFRDGAIEDLNARFARLHPGVAGAALSPECSKDMCSRWSRIYQAWLISGGIEAELYNCRGFLGDGSRHAWRDIYEEGKSPDWGTFHHMVVRVGGWLVDWSRRQIDSDAPAPLVQGFSEASREWTEIGKWKGREGE